MRPCPRCGEWTSEPSRFCPQCGSRLSEVPLPEERRKIVTTIFADVVGSTEMGEKLDAETLRWAMQRWFHLVRDAVERHGGTVERYIGDAVMAVFGIPVAHEDDALRAVRAAVDIRDADVSLRKELQLARQVDLAVRIGVNTGEAVTGAATVGGSFTAGDAVNVAARLEQSARPGEILLGRETLRLVAHAVDAAPVVPLTVKGKSAAIEAYRLMRVVPAAPARPQRRAAPLVDRVDERLQLRDAFERTVRGGSCQVCTVMGVAGVGKSRLVGDVVAELRRDATVASGRCLPYGDALTWWPLMEALGRGGLLERLAGDDHPAFPRAAELLKPEGDPVAPDEAIWAIRVVLEALARERPLVLVVDDLHWAAPTLLDLLEHLAESVRDAQVLLLATARPELLDVRPGWGADGPNVGSVRLEPLGDEDATELLHHLAGPTRLAGRILEAAAGNPLFVVEFAAMLSEGGAQERTAIGVPPTIHALLAARLDGLGRADRRVLEAASIGGKAFAREPVLALLGDQRPEALDARLDSLVRKGLIEREDGSVRRFRFHHQLICDATYEAMPKELRSDLHLRFARAMERRLPASPAREELLGHHRERAVVLRRELGEDTPSTAEVAALAAASLGSAARSASQREDPAAAVALLRRAIALVQSDAPRRDALLSALGAALFEAGHTREALSVLDDAVARAPDPRSRARAAVEREFVRLEVEPGAGTERAQRLAGDVLGEFERAGDDEGQCRAWSLRAQAAWVVGHAQRADAAWERAAACAARAGDERDQFAALARRAMAAVWGPTPVEEAIRRCETFRRQVGSSPVAVASIDNPLAALHAMRGDFARADEYLRAAIHMREQLGSLGWAVSHFEGLVRMLTGRADLAERHLRAGIDRLSDMDDRGLLATATAMRAQALYALCRWEEASECCRLVAGIATADDIVTQAVWRGVEAKVLARRGRVEEAETLARAGVALLAPTDLLSHRGDAMLDLAEILRATSGRPMYLASLGAALVEYEHKVNAVGAGRVRALLGEQAEEQ